MNCVLPPQAVEMVGNDMAIASWSGRPLRRAGVPVLGCGRRPRRLPG